jgi:hypothetical protein
MLLTAKRETLKRRQELEDYIVWRKAEEDRRYLEILGTEMSREDMDIFKSGIAALREKDNVLMEAVEEARRTEEEAARLRDEAVNTLRQRRKDKEKIEEHRKIWQTAETREIERLEDLEIEEVSRAKPLDFEL